MDLKISHVENQTSYKTIIPGTRLEDGTYKVYLKAEKHIDGNGGERISEYKTGGVNYVTMNFAYKRPSSKITMYPFYRISYIGTKYKVDYAIRFDVKYTSYSKSTISDAVIEITNNNDKTLNYYTEVRGFEDGDTSSDVSFSYEYIPSFKLVNETSHNLNMTYKSSGYDTEDLYKRSQDSSVGTYKISYNQSDFDKLYEIIDEEDIIPTIFNNNWEEVLPDNTTIDVSFKDIKNKTLPYIPKIFKYKKSSGTGYDYFANSFTNNALYYKSRLFRHKDVNNEYSYYRRYDTHYGTSIPSGYTKVTLDTMDNLLNFSTEVFYKSNINKCNLTISHTKNWDTTNANLYKSDYGKINTLTLHLVREKTKEEVKTIDIRNFDKSYTIDNLDNDNYTYYISGHTELTDHINNTSTPKLISVKPDAEEVVKMEKEKITNNKYRFTWEFTIENYSSVCFCVDEKQSNNTYVSKFKMRNTPYLYETYDGFESGKTYKVYLKFDSGECTFSSPDVAVEEFTA